MTNIYQAAGSGNAATLFLGLGMLVGLRVDPLLLVTLRKLWGFRIVRWSVAGSLLSRHVWLWRFRVLCSLWEVLHPLCRSCALVSVVPRPSGLALGSWFNLAEKASDEANQHDCTLPLAGDISVAQKWKPRPQLGLRLKGQQSQFSQSVLSQTSNGPITKAWSSKFKLWALIMMILHHWCSKHLMTTVFFCRKGPKT